MMLELQHLKTLFNSSSTIIGSTSMANSGKNEIFSSLTFLTKNLTTAWILDSGATDHMTPFPHIFVSYETIAPGKHVQTADETLLSVMGIDTVNLQPMGLITHVFFLELTYNPCVARTKTLCKSCLCTKTCNVNKL